MSENVKISSEIERTQYERDLAQSRSNRERDQKRQEEQRNLEQAQKEFDDYQRQQYELQQQINAQEADRQAIEARKQAITEKYSTVIKGLESERSSLILQEKQNKQVNYQPAIQSVNYKIDQARKDEYKEFSYLEYSQQYGNRPLTKNEATQFRDFIGTKNQKSLVEVVSSRQASRDLVTQQRVESSKKTAQSETINEQTKLEFTIRGFEEEKNKSPQAENITDILSKYELQKATKRAPGIRPSTGFLTPDFENPLSIEGTTEIKSKQAVLTFEETELQQQQLFKEITGAKNPKEATAIKTRYQEANPYVGTPQTYLYKGQVKNTQGVLIEKKLLEKYPTSYKPITSGKDELIKTLPVGVTEIITTDKATPSYYLFLDAKGNTIKPTNEQLYAYSKYLQGLEIEKPTQTELKMNQYIQENKEGIIQTEKSGQSGEAYPLIDIKKDTFVAGVLGHANELYATGYNLFEPNEEKQIKNRPTLEALVFSDLITKGKEILFPGQLPPEKPSESQALIEIQKKAQTPQGLEYLAGSIATSIIIVGATAIIPPLAIAKYGRYFVQPKTFKRAQEIAYEIFKSKQEKTLAQPLEEQVSPKIRGQIPKPQPEPYGVEMISPKTALITSGTESAQTKTPYIVYTRGNRFTSGISKIYRPISEESEVITPKNIMIKGTQTKELESGKQVTKNIKTYPASTTNLEKVSKPEISNYLAKVGTMKEVLSKDLEKNPRAVVESVASEKPQTGTIITETERRNTIKGFMKDVEQLPEAGSMIKEVKPTKSTTSKTEFNLDKPTSDVIKLPPSSESKTVQVSTKEAPATRREQLKQISKEVAQEQGKYDFTISESQKGIINLGTRGATDYGSSYKIGSKLESKQSQKLQTNQLQQAKISTQSKQESILDSIDILKTQQTKLEKERPILDPRYSLIVRPGQKDTTEFVPRYIVTQKLEVTPKLDIPTEPEIPQRTTTKTPFGIIDLGEPTTKKSKGKEGSKPKSLFFSWNVDVKRPGGYLAGKELRVGKTQKVFSQTAKAQRQADKISKTKIDTQFDVFKKEKTTIRRSPNKKPTRKEIKKENISNLDRMIYKKGNKKKVFGLF